MESKDLKANRRKNLENLGQPPREVAPEPTYPPVNADQPSEWRRDS